MTIKMTVSILAVVLLIDSVGCSRTPLTADQEALFDEIGTLKHADFVVASNGQRLMVCNDQADSIGIYLTNSVFMPCNGDMGLRSPRSVARYTTEVVRTTDAKWAAHACRFLQGENSANCPPL